MYVLEYSMKFEIGAAGNVAVQTSAVDVSAQKHYSRGLYGGVACSIAFIKGQLYLHLCRQVSTYGLPTKLRIQAMAFKPE
jgi:hypothetical protein